MILNRYELLISIKKVTNSGDILKNSTIAVSGKGGVGKTTIAALLIKVLSEREKGVVLALDADPNSCLADYLGLKVEKNIGCVREEIIKNLSEIPSGMTKENLIELRVQDCIVESKCIDLIELGRPEGPGCYCYINNIMRDYELSVHRNYSTIVIDNEAGMEHLSRRANQPIDYLLIVSDISKPGLKAAKRINELSSELNLVTLKKGLILNRANEDQIKRSLSMIEDTGLEVIGSIPVDPLLEESNFNDSSIIEISENSPALKAVRMISMKLDQ